MIYSIKLALRSLIYRKSQYLSLFLVCLFGAAVSLCSISISSGMIKSLNRKAKIYYGGDFTLMCSYGKGLEIYDYKEKLEKIKSLLPSDACLSARIDFAARRNSSLYFEGSQALQQTIKGIRLEDEKELLSSFTFAEGSLNEVDPDNFILLSSPVASLLNVRPGDEVTLQLKTLDGLLNTVNVKVGAVFLDSSAFGMYTSYINFDILKTARNYPENYADRICVNFGKKSLSEKELHEYYSLLSREFNFEPYVTEKDSFTDRQYSFERESWGFIPLSANLTEVQVMEKAMNAVITFVIIMLTLIIIAGIGSTYRVIIMKRINEIGIYMAVGMKKRSILISLIFESLLLLLAGCLSGLALSLVLNRILLLPDFSFIPAFDMFLENGNLTPAFDVIKSAAVLLSIISATLAAVIYSSLKSIRIMPVDALAETE